MSHVELQVIARDGTLGPHSISLHFTPFSNLKMMIRCNRLDSPYLSYIEIKMLPKAAPKSKRENQDGSIMGASANNPSTRESANTD